MCACGKKVRCKGLCGPCYQRARARAKGIKPKKLVPDSCRMPVCLPIPLIEIMTLRAKAAGLSFSELARQHLCRIYGRWE